MKIAQSLQKKIYYLSVIICMLFILSCKKTTVATAVGAASVFAGSGVAGFKDGVDSVAQFNVPLGIAADAQGNVYVNDSKNNRIRKITAGGLVSTFAGSGVAGYKDSTSTNARFNGPNEGLAVDAQGNIYVSDPANGRIRKITAAGNVTTLAGDGKYGFANGLALNAEFRISAGIAVDAQGNVYAADCYNNCIRKISTVGIVSTLAGGTQGFANGTGADAEFWLPRGIAVDGPGNVYVVDCNNERIRKVTPAGVVTTFAGSGQPGFVDGPAAAAAFYLPDGIAVDAQGNVYVGDQSNNAIRKITAAGVVSTIGGDGLPGFKNGIGRNTEFNQPWGVTVDAQGNVYVADAGNNRIRKITQ